MTQGTQVHLTRSIQEIINLLDHSVILDTETTRMFGEVIEIAIVDGATGTVLFNSLVHPTAEIIEVKATEVHGIQELDVWDKHTFAQLWPRIEPLLATKNIITYNAPYDKDRLIQSAQYAKVLLPSMTWLCAMRAYAAYWGETGKFGSPKWQSLEKACAQQGVSLQGAHRAVNDALATYIFSRPSL